MERQFIIIRNTDTFKTKTGRERVIPLAIPAQSVIFRRKESASGEYVFQINGEPLKADTVTHSFKKAVRLAGLSDGIHLHSLRHTFASLLIQAGANISAVKDILGHSTINTTQIYLHNTSDSLRHELEKIPSLT
jgi:site-specific recombinase XerD